VNMFCTSCPALLNSFIKWSYVVGRATGNPPVMSHFIAQGLPSMFSLEGLYCSRKVLLTAMILKSSASIRLTASFSLNQNGFGDILGKFKFILRLFAPLISFFHDIISRHFLFTDSPSHEYPPIETLTGDNNFPKGI